MAYVYNGKLISRISTSSKENLVLRSMERVSCQHFGGGTLVPTKVYEAIVITPHLRVYKISDEEISIRGVSLGKVPIPLSLLRGNKVAKKWLQKIGVASLTWEAEFVKRRGMSSLDWEVLHTKLHPALLSTAGCKTKKEYIRRTHHDISWKNDKITNKYLWDQEKYPGLRGLSEEEWTFLGGGTPAKSEFLLRIDIPRLRKVKDGHYSVLKRVIDTLHDMKDDWVGLPTDPELLTIFFRKEAQRTAEDLDYEDMVDRGTTAVLIAGRVAARECPPPKCG